MDKNGKKVVAFSFFSEKEDLRDIQRNDWDRRMTEWKKSGSKGTPPLKSKDKKSLRIFFKRDQKEIDNLYWRPSTALAISLSMDEGIVIDEYNLLYQPKWKGHDREQKEGANYIKDAIERLTEKHTTVNLVEIDIGNGHDFETIYCALYDYFRTYIGSHKEVHESDKRPRYLVSVSSGSQATCMCLFLLAQNRWIPAECVQLWKDDSTQRNKGKCSITNPILPSNEYKELARRRKNLTEDNISKLKQHIKTVNENYNSMIEQIEEIAVKTNEPILLLGETGAGKSKIARLISEVRKTKIFKQFNCSGFKGDLVDSTLFGHTKGAFTGADADKKGIVELANNGVLFLDEIGNLPLETQGKLLTLLDTHTYTRLGDEEQELTSNFLLICATNEDLLSLVEQGNFRRDLFERIRTWTFTIPSLADRKEDIDPNIDKELENFRTDYERNVELSGQSRQMFLEYVKGIPLKGNFRELRRMIVHMATFAEDGTINIGLVKDEIERHQNENSLSLTSEAKTKIPETNSDKEDLIEKVLEKIAPSYKSNLDLINLAQLHCVIKVCIRSDIKSAAEAGRELYAQRTKRGKNGNASSLLSHYFKSKAIKDLGIDFKSIKEACRNLN